MCLGINTGSGINIIKIYDMIRLVNAFYNRQFAFFIVVGGIAALVNFGSRFAYNEFVNYGRAVIFAHFTGMIIAFTLNKIFVFKKSVHSPGKQFGFFAMVNLFAVFQVYVISVGLAFYVFPMIGFEIYPKAVAHACGIVSTAFTSYMGHKKISFKSQV